jgi:hypothetical protein
LLEAGGDLGRLFGLPLFRMDFRGFWVDEVEVGTLSSGLQVQAAASGVSEIRGNFSSLSMTPRLLVPFPKIGNNCT